MVTPKNVNLFLESERIVFHGSGTSQKLYIPWSAMRLYKAIRKEARENQIDGEIRVVRGSSSNICSNYSLLIWRDREGEAKSLIALSRRFLRNCHQCEEQAKTLWSLVQQVHETGLNRLYLEPSCHLVYHDKSLEGFVPYGLKTFVGEVSKCLEFHAQCHICTLPDSDREDYLLVIWKRYRGLSDDFIVLSRDAVESENTEHYIKLIESLN